MQSARTRAPLAVALGLALAAALRAEPAPTDLYRAIDAGAASAADRVVAWRRDLHAHPELSNREFRSGELAARELARLGLEVRRKVAKTGALGILRGARPGRVIGLRADLDALPVREELDLPFASRAVAELDGREVGVMHACGHDAHTAMLLGAAQVLAGLRDELAGTIVFLFQPAEERPPPGETGGAPLVLAEGALDDPRPELLFALHAQPEYEVGQVAYRAGPAMASSDRLHIALRGRQSHAAHPWQGSDTLAAAARLLLELQALPGRAVDARLPSVVSIGQIQGGLRHNILPGQVELWGTIRALDPGVRSALHERVRRTARGIAESSGIELAVEIPADGYPIAHNDPGLVARMRPTLERVAGADRAIEGQPLLGAEDFAFYQQRMPGLLLWLGVRPRGTPAADAAPNHSPRFFVDEGALELGVRLLANLAVDALAGARD